MEYNKLLKQEEVVQRDYSPGIVLNEETLARVLFFPRHYKNGKLSPSSFEQIHDPNGMSVLRQEHEFSECLENTIKIVESKNETKKYIGYASCSVNNIRNVLYGEYRLFYILDTATKDRPGHADIFTTKKVLGIPKGLINDFINSKLFRLFDDNVTIEKNEKDFN